jgi:preprotein translocase subunit SecE
MAKENKPRKKPTRGERKAAAARKAEQQATNEQSNVAQAQKKEEKKPHAPSMPESYLKGVRSELKAMTWPSPKERRNASIAVFAALIFFGVLIYALDTGIVPVLGWYASI